MPEDPAATATADPPAKTEPGDKTEPEGGDKPLGAAGEKALEAFKERAREAEAKIKELEPLAAKAREAEEANKTELEKANGKAAQLDDQVKTLTGENLRLRVALEKKIPAELIDRLKGNSKEELEADAEELLKLVGGGNGTATDFGGGARTPAPTGGMDEQIRRRAGAA